MHDLLMFHSVHGKAIQLSDGNRLATRSLATISDGLVFSSKPIKVNQKVGLMLTLTTEWFGNLRVGMTAVDPLGYSVGSTLPSFAIPDMVLPENDEDRQSWATPVSGFGLESVGCCLTLHFCPDGSLKYWIGRAFKGVLLKDLPTDRPLWLFLDIYGNTTSVSLTQPVEGPDEIIIQGPAAIQCYQDACEQSGSQSVYRTRLIIIGQDTVGKAELYQRLAVDFSGQPILSSSTIDLSASYSFCLSSRSAWKLVPSVEDLFVDKPARNTVADSDDSHQETDFTRASASNIALEILRRQRYCDNKIAHSPSNSDLTPNSSDTLVMEMVESEENVASKTISLSGSSVDLTSHELLLEESEAVVQMVQEMLSIPAAQRQKSVDASSDRDEERQLLVNVVDCLSDELCYATSQVFLSCRAVYMIVFDLCWDLNDCPSSNSDPESPDIEEMKTSGHPFHAIKLFCQNEVMWVHGREESIGGESFPPTSSVCLSHLDYIEHWIKAIHCSAAMVTNNNNNNNNKGCGCCSATTRLEANAVSPPVYVVGTNLNSLHSDPSEQRKLAEEKFDKIRKVIESIQSPVVTEYYAIDGDHDLSTCDDQINELRQRIELAASREPYMGEQIPFRWLQFEQSLERLVSSGTNCCSFGQLREVSLEDGIETDEEFEAMLQFYHHLGIIIYDESLAPSAAAGFVILKPSWLVEMCKSILSADIVTTFAKKPNEEALLRHYCCTGILYEQLIDLVWSKNLDQKAILLRFMEKMDLIAERYIRDSTWDKKLGRSFVVPSLLANKCSNDRELYNPNMQDVEFYYEFFGFLPETLFFKTIIRIYRWSQDFGGNEAQISSHGARFYLDSEHDFVILMAPKHLARFKVAILRVVDLDGRESMSSNSGDEKRILLPPKPHAAAKVRNFLEMTLCELREIWMRRLSYRALLRCPCDRVCTEHQQRACLAEDCLHFLSLDECLSNKIVCCEYRRVRTSSFRKAFPAASKTLVNHGPVLPDRIMLTALGNQSDKSVSIELPSWIKSTAKMLNGGSEGEDWSTLATKLGYKKNRIDEMNYELNPAQALITDWILTSGNTSLSVDMIVTCLEQMQRDDIVEVIQKGQEQEAPPPHVFISYQWDSQDEVNVLRDTLEKVGFTCWMDIGQMGGGDHLYAKIYEGIKNAKIVIACLSNKYIVSHHCNRELILADLLHKPIIPVMYEQMSWPPPGPMSLIFSQLVYINIKGIGGHGGSGIHADLDAKYQEIVNRVSNHASPHSKPFVDFSPKSSNMGNLSGKGSRTNDQTVDGQNAQQAMQPGFRLPSQTGRRTDQHQEQAGDSMAGNSRIVQQANVVKCAVCTIL